MIRRPLVLQIGIMHVSGYGIIISQVEESIKELAKKQADLERREKELEETQRGLNAATSLVTAAPTPGSKSGITAGITQTTAAAATSAAATATKAVAGTALADVTLAAGTQQYAFPHVEGVEQIVESEAVAVIRTGTGATEWVEYWDESAGASYFFNTITQVCERRDEP